MVGLAIDFLFLELCITSGLSPTSSCSLGRDILIRSRYRASSKRWNIADCLSRPLFIELRIDLSVPVSHVLLVGKVLGNGSLSMLCEWCLQLCDARCLSRVDIHHSFAVRLSRSVHQRGLAGSYQTF
eukprot:6464041-Amphidinium_carterae.1